MYVCVCLGYAWIHLPYDLAWNHARTVAMLWSWEAPTFGAWKYGWLYHIWSNTLWLCQT